MNTKTILALVGCLLLAVGIYAYIAMYGSGANDASNGSAGSGESKSGSGEGNAATPAVIPKSDLLTFYPEGKKVRSVGIFSVTGKGKNQNWIVSTDCFFSYEYKLLVESDIIKNDGREIVTEVLVKSADEILIDSEHAFDWRDLENPQLKTLWFVADKLVGRRYPLYAMFSTATQWTPELINLIPDKYGMPAAEWIKTHWGLELLPSDTPKEVVAKFKKIMGYKFRIVFDEALNVVGDPEVLVEGPEEVSMEEIRRFAKSENILFDHVLGPATNKSIGGETDLDAKQLTRMIGSSYDATSTGTIKVSRAANKDEFKRLRVDGGQVRVRVETPSGPKSGIVTPNSGIIEFSDKGKFVAKAKLDWQMEASWFDESHLLFGTEAMRNVSVVSYYEAALVDIE